MNLQFYLGKHLLCYFRYDSIDKVFYMIL